MAWVDARKRRRWRQAGAATVAAGIRLGRPLAATLMPEDARNSDRAWLEDAFGRLSGQVDSNGTVALRGGGRDTLYST